jgi:multiple sugar transport system ATP-binding protein
MASVDIVNVKKSFDRTEILRGISVTIHDGEFVVLVGPSGCGKTTLLRMIAGLEAITSGDIRIGERVVNDLAPKDRDIAMVFQNYALYPHMSVADNMAFSLRMRGVARADIEQRVKRASSILGLDDYLARYPRHLSGGQRQRVAMGRAIVRDPQVFLFDEPLSNLDAKLRVAMRSEIKELHQRLKTTMIYVTHDQIEAMTMADRIVVMRQGSVEQIGAPLELYDQPANLFVAGFIGSPAMNMFTGTVAVAGRPGFAIDNGAFIALKPSKVFEDCAGRPLVCGIRPEHLHVAGDGTSGFEAKAKIVEPTGSETQVTATVNGNDIIALFRDRQAVRQGDTLRLSPSQYHLFDAGSGQRIASVAA